MISRLIPPEIRVEHHREKQIVPVIDHDQLSTRTFERRVINQVLLSAVGTDIAFERKLARDDFFDGDLLVPAVAAVFLFASRLRDFLRTAERAPRFGNGLAWHTPKSITLRAILEISRP